MTSRPSRFSRRVLLAAPIVMLALPAAGQRPPSELQGPRAAGQVGERYDGYAVVRGAAPADVQALVAQVNTRRRTWYEQKAAEQKAPVEAVARIYAEKIWEHVPVGTWLLRENGQWVQK